MRVTASGGEPAVYTQDIVAPLSQVLAQTINGTTTSYRYGQERLATIQGLSRSWSGTDALGSVRQSMSDTGSVSAPTHYDPWGTPTSGTATPFGFTGELQDAATGLVQLRARWWYVPEHAAFAARDPFAGFPQQPASLHPYQYAYSNPVLYTDPSGWCGVLERIWGCSRPHPSWTPEELAAFEERHPYPYQEPIAQLPGVSHHTPAQAEAYAQAYGAFVANPSAYGDESDTYTYAAVFAEDYLHTTILPDHLPSFLEEWECLQQRANTQGLTEDEAWDMFYLGMAIGVYMPGADRLMAPSDHDGGGRVSSGKQSGTMLGLPSRMPVNNIRYSQSTYSQRGDGYTIAQNVQWLKDHPGLDLPAKPVRIFRKRPEMNKWGEMTHKGYTGDPKNLLDGEVYTLDHRRLVAYKQAGRSDIPVEWVLDDDIIRQERFKFSTMNYGSSIDLR